MEVPKFGKRTLNLLASGVIMINVHYAGEGMSCMANVSQPHPRLGVFPWQQFPVEELVDKLDKVCIPLGNKQPGGTPGGKLPDNFSLSDRIARGDRIKTVVTHGIVNQLPIGTLCYHDLLLPRTDVGCRAAFIAENIGTAKAVSRIATDRKNLAVSGAANLHEWWERSTSYQKWLILTTRSRVGKAPRGFSYEILPDAFHRILNSIQFPFRDAEIEMGSETIETWEDDESYSKGSLEDENEGVIFD